MAISTRKDTLVASRILSMGRGDFECAGRLNGRVSHVRIDRGVGKDSPVF
jgi:hypothetical protein